MGIADNLFDTTRNFMTPDSIQKFCHALDEPEDKVQSGLRSVIPTFLSGLIDEGSTSQGAQKIVALVKAEDFNTDMPSNLNDKNYLSMGEHAVEDIFGQNYHSIATSLTPQTGLNPLEVEKMMEMIAPMVLGVIGNKVKNEGMSASNLSGFLQQQKKVLKGFTPAATGNFKGPEYPQVINRREIERKKVSFFLFATLILAAMALFLWYLARTTLPVSDFSRELIEVNRVPAENSGLKIEELPSFLKSGSESELPKRFSFARLSFDKGTTDLTTSGDGELDSVASSLKQFPQSTAMIEAYIESTGDDETNLLLSENRAMIVREELIGRGIEPSRIRAEGRGASLDNIQVQFVITGLK